MKRKTIFKSTLINLFSRASFGILQVIQIIIIARIFGASYIADSYMIAKWLPLFVWAIGDTVLLYSLVPFIVSISVKKGKQDAKRTIDQIFSWFLIIFLIAALVVFLVSPLLVRLFVPGFTEEAHKLTTDLLRLLSPVIFLGGLAAFLSSILYSMRKFLMPAITTLLPSIGVISFLLVFVKKWSIQTAVFGFEIGLLFQLLGLILVLARYKMLPRINFKKSGEVKKVFTQIGPRFGGVVLNRIIFAVDRFFASLIGVGSVAILTYSYRSAQLPAALVAAAFGKTLLPTLSKMIAEDKMDKVKIRIPRYVGLLLFTLMPLVILLIYFRVPIIRILYERGNFTFENTIITADLFIFYTLALVFQCIATFFSGIFFAAGNTRTPFIITLISFVLNAILDFIFIRFWDFTGIAIATLIISIISVVLLFNRLSNNFGRIGLKPILGSFFKIITATGIMGIVVWLSSDFLLNILHLSLPDLKILHLLILSLFTCLIFLFICFILRLEELKYMKSLIKKGGI